MSIPEILLAVDDSLEASIVIKTTLLLAIGLTVARVATRAKASARHLILATTFAALLALPIVATMAPQVTIPVPVNSAIVLTVADNPSYPVIDAQFAPLPPVPQQRTMPAWAGIIRALWIGGAIFQLLLLSLNLLRLRNLRRAGIPWLDHRELMRSLTLEAGVGRRIDLLLHEDIAAPIMTGLLHPAILLPVDARSWSEADLRRALIHELEHVRRGDWATQLFARVAVACYWFHPLTWIAWRRLCLEAELACDDAVLRSAESTEYAEQLVGLARRMSNTQARPALGMANRSDLSARVSALLDSSQQRGRAGIFAAAGAVALAGLVLMAIAPLTAVAQLSSSQSNGQKSSRRATALDRALYEAAEAGDLQEIDDLLNAGANVNAVIQGDGSPLIGAARKGRLTAVARLLDRGADPNMPVHGDGNALIMAAAAGHANVVSLLVDRGARIDEVVPSDENALIQASGKGRLEVVKLLVSRGANVNMRLFVEESGAVGGISGVVGGVPGGVIGGVPGVRVRSADSSGEWRSPLIMARKGGHQAVVDYLVKSGARE